MKEFKPFPGPHFDTKKQAYGDPMTRALNGEGSGPADQASELAFAVDESNRHLGAKAIENAGAVVKQIDVENAASNSVNIVAPTATEALVAQTPVTPEIPAAQIPATLPEVVSAPDQTKTLTNA